MQWGHTNTADIRCQPNIPALLKGTGIIENRITILVTSSSRATRFTRIIKGSGTIEPAILRASHCCNDEKKMKNPS